MLDPTCCQTVAVEEGAVEVEEGAVEVEEGAVAEAVEEPVVVVPAGVEVVE